MRIAGEIVELVRVAFEIEELLLAVTGVKDVFRAAVGERVPMVLGAVADIVFEVDILAPARAGTADQRQQAAAVDLAIQRGGGGFQEGRQDVPQLDWLRKRLAARRRYEPGGPPHHHRDVRGWLVW